ncbi:MAG: cytochrome c-type biogenesis protein CcmH [Acidobacteriota bacterium]
MRLLSHRATQSAVVRFAVLPIVIVLGVVTMGTADTQARFTSLGNKLMCMCGCNQVLLQCDHIGCPSAGREMTELRAAIGRGETQDQIFRAFANEYGATVLAAPWLTKFNILAWVVPPGMLILGLVGTFFLVRKWRLRTVPMPAVAQDPASNDLRDRIRKETEI